MSGFVNKLDHLTRIASSLHAIPHSPRIAGSVVGSRRSQLLAYPRTVAHIRPKQLWDSANSGRSAGMPHSRTKEANPTESRQSPKNLPILLKPSKAVQKLPLWGIWLEPNNDWGSGETGTPATKPYGWGRAAPASHRFGDSQGMAQNVMDSSDHRESARTRIKVGVRRVWLKPASSSAVRGTSPCIRPNRGVWPHWPQAVHLLHIDGDQPVAEQNQAIGWNRAIPVRVRALARNHPNLALIARIRGNPLRTSQTGYTNRTSATKNAAFARVITGHSSVLRKRGEAG